MPDHLKPRDARDVEAAVQWALAEGKALELVGHGSKRAIGRPAPSDLTLALSGLSGGTLYQPEELVLSAQAGTPRSETEETVLIRGLDSARAVAAMTSAMGSSCDVSGAAHLPAEVAARIPVGEIAGAGGAVTALRLEGFAPSVSHRKGSLIALMK